MPQRRIEHVDLFRLASDILARGSGFRFSAHGTSMSPFIEDGDIAEIRPISRSDIAVGDILLIKDRESNLRLHRLIRATTENNTLMLLTQGDAALHTDGACTLDEVVGRAESIQRGAREIRVRSAPLRVLGLAWAYGNRISQPMRRAATRMYRAVRRRVCMG